MVAAHGSRHMRANTLNLKSRLLVGIDVGVRGAGLVLLWFALHSILIREFWWAKLNVLGSFFYGLSAFSAGLGRVTVAGLAMLVVLYGLGGAVLAAVMPERMKASMRLLLTAGFVALWQFAMTRVILPWISPFTAAYFSDRVVFIANLLFLLVLLRLGRKFLPMASPPPAVQEPAAFEQINPASEISLKPPDQEEIWTAEAQPPQSESQ